MIVDTHTHVYPDKIAKAIEEMSVKDVAEEAKLYGSLTVSGLLASMQQNGVSACLTFCIAEKPEVVTRANDFIMKSCDGKRLFGLGTIHPDFKDYRVELDRLRQAGIKGVKWSSLFQGFTLDDERMFRLYVAMGEDMVAYFHVGRGPSKYIGHEGSTPERLARVLKAFPKMKVVAAHFGGMKMLDEARKHIIGKTNVYLDTAWTSGVGSIGEAELVKVIREHGADKVLFGTDYPFCDVKQEIATIGRLPLTGEEKEQILWKNANRLFGLGLE